MNDKDQLFTSILHLFYSSGMQGFGKMPNPIDQSLQIDLQQAEESIQILEILAEKTKGNLSPELSQILTQFLAQLKAAKAEF